jgi:hypothetical protein
VVDAVGSVVGSDGRLPAPGTVVMVESAGVVFVIAGVDGTVAESDGLIRKITSTVTNTTAHAAPIAVYSSERGRVGFQAVLVWRCVGFRRFVTSSESYR